MVSGIRLDEVPLGRLRIIFDYSRSSPLAVDGGSREFVLLAAAVKRRKGTDASTATLSFIDLSGATARALSFGMPLRVEIDGHRRFSGAIVGLNRDEVSGSSIMVEIEAQGLARLPFTARAPSAYSGLAGLTTHAAASYAVLNWAKGIMADGTSAISPSVTVPTPFPVDAGESVGSILERLRALDGADFYVDEAHDAGSIPELRYLSAAAAASLATVTPDDLLGEPGSRAIKDGALPPKNSVRIKGPSSSTTSYLASTLQENQTSYHRLDAVGKYAAMRFYASRSILSALQLYANRTTAANQPGAASIEIREDARVTFATENYLSGAGSLSLSSTNWAGTLFTVPASSAAFVILKHLQLKTDAHAGGSDVIIEVRNASGSVPGATILFSGVATDATSGNPTVLPEIELVPGETYAIVMRISGALATNAKYDNAMVGGRNLIGSSDSGATWTQYTSFDLSHYLVYDIKQPGSAVVEWSDDNSMSASDLPYPAAWAAKESWTAPKLALSAGSYYWLVIKASSDASGSKYWELGQAANAYSDKWLATTSDSGATWTPAAFALSLRLYFEESTDETSIDVTRTNARSRLTSAVSAGATSLPVAELQDFSTLPTTVRIGGEAGEDVTVTARSASSGAGTLTCSALASGWPIDSLVDAYSIRSYGVWHYEESSNGIASADEAAAIALLILSKHAEPARRISLPFARFRSDITPYAPILVKRPLLGIEQSLVAEEVEDRLMSDGSILTFATCGAIEFNIARAQEELRKKVL